MTLHERAIHREHDEGDQRDAGNAIGFEAIRAGSNGIAGVIASTIGNHARVASIVFFDFENDLHEIGADIGNLGENAAGYAQRRRAERFANREADEARAGVIMRNEEQDEEHEHKFDADEQHADAHAGFKWNLVTRKGLPVKLAKAQRELAKVLTRMPNQATPELPQIPMTLNIKMMNTLMA